MPELPEVQTIVDGLENKIKGKKILDISYCDAKKLIRHPSFERFKKEIRGKKIEKVERRAKNILIFLSGEKILAIHLKMTGHILIISNFKFLISNEGVASRRYISIKDGRWVGDKLPKELQDPKNQFIHLILNISGGVILAYSDVRKFGEIRLENLDYLSRLESKLGPEPLDPEFTLNAFKEILDTSGGKIKAVLMDQKKIAGIGNIYGDEILFFAGVRPDRTVKSLNTKEIEKIYKSIAVILKKAIKYRGSSESDYRDVSGKKGDYQKHSYVYRKNKNACVKCGGEIRKIKIGQRSAHYCIKCQK